MLGTLAETGNARVSSPFLGHFSSAELLNSSRASTTLQTYAELNLVNPSGTPASASLCPLLGLSSSLPLSMLNDIFDLIVHLVSLSIEHGPGCLNSS